MGDLVYRLLEDPRPLCAALGRYPQTLLHGDSKLANIGLALMTAGELAVQLARDQRAAQIS